MLYSYATLMLIMMINKNVVWAPHLATLPISCHLPHHHVRYLPNKNASSLACVQPPTTKHDYHTTTKHPLKVILDRTVMALKVFPFCMEAVLSPTCKSVMAGSIYSCLQCLNILYDFSLLNETPSNKAIFRGT